MVNNSKSLLAPLHRPSCASPAKHGCAAASIALIAAVKRMIEPGRAYLSSTRGHTVDVVQLAPVNNPNCYAQPTEFVLRLYMVIHLLTCGASRPFTFKHEQGSHQTLAGYSGTRWIAGKPQLDAESELNNINNLYGDSTVFTNMHY